MLPAWPPAVQLHWLLLASEADGAATAEAAQRLVRQYEWRWGLEECFRLLKTGAGLQDRQWQDAASLGKALAFDAVETYRVFSLQRLAREASDTPAATVLEADEEACLHTLLALQRLLPPQERDRPPARDIRSVTIYLARLVGFQPSQRQPLPGPELLWRGYQRLRLVVPLWRAGGARPPAAASTEAGLAGPRRSRPTSAGTSLRAEGPLARVRKAPGPAGWAFPCVRSLSFPLGPSRPPPPRLPSAWTARHPCRARDRGSRAVSRPAFPTPWLAFGPSSPALSQLGARDRYSPETVSGRLAVLA